LLPHVSQRQRAHIFPRIEDATYIFLDIQGVIEPFQTQEEYQAAVEAVRHDLPLKLSLNKTALSSFAASRE
jgi:hypothetical protein